MHFYCSQSLSSLDGDEDDDVSDGDLSEDDSDDLKVGNQFLDAITHYFGHDCGVFLNCFVFMIVAAWKRFGRLRRIGRRFER